MEISSPDPPTERSLDLARDLDRRSLGEVLTLIHQQDGRAHAAVGRCLPEMELAAKILVAALEAGSRWFNLGAGTSGRLGVLDASEIPPTYGLQPEIVQGLIAGGEVALRHPVEGAEDDSLAALRELRARDFGRADVLVGISASGQTPFALAGMKFAREIGARSIAISCDPNSPLARAADVAITPEVGAEVVAGSTRMKGGLAQKMVLTALSTAVMIKLGKVRGNLMTHVTPVSKKLRGRAERIVMEIAGVNRMRARSLLRRSRGCVEGALELASHRN